MLHKEREVLEVNKLDWDYRDCMVKSRGACLPCCGVVEPER